MGNAQDMIDYCRASIRFESSHCEASERFID